MLCVDCTSLTVMAGRFGEVRQATNKRTGEDAAIKISQMEPGTSDEVQTMLSVDHICIVKLHAAYAFPALTLVMELCHGQDLWHRAQGRS